MKDIFLYQYVPKCKFKGQKKHDFLEQREHLEKQSSAWFLQSDKKFFPLKFNVSLMNAYCKVYMLWESQILIGQAA